MSGPGFGMGSGGRGSAASRRVVTRKMPGQSTQVSTGASVAPTIGVRRGALDLVGQNTQVAYPGQTPREAEGNPYPKRRRVMITQPIGMGSRKFNTVTTNGKSREPKVAMGGSTQEELNAMARWVGSSASLPNMGGRPAPDMSQELRGEGGYPMYANMGMNPGQAGTSVLPNSRTPGSGGLAWGGFGAKRTELNTQQPGPSPGGNAGTGASSFFITPGEQISGRQQLRNVFLSYPWSTAEQEINQDGNIEFPVNAVIPYTFLVDVGLRSHYEDNQEAQIVLIQRKKLPVADETDRLAPVPKAHMVTVTMFNLATWNYMQACNENMPMQQGRSLTPQEVLQHWSIAGGVRNDPSSRLAAGSGNSAYPNQFGQWKRIFNTVLGGPVWLYNLWGNNISYGSKVYLILKKIDNSMIVADSKNETASYNISLGSPDDTIKCEDPTKTNRPFQLIPWAPRDVFGRPKPADLMYRDEWGVKRYGIAFCLGTVHQIDDFDTPQTTLAHAPFSVSETARLPKIQIIQSIRRIN